MARSSRRRKNLRQGAASAPRKARIQGPDWEPSWRILTPEQQFLNSCGLALIVGTMLLHGMGGVVYGRLTIFTLVSFEEMPGWVAAWGSASVWCLAAAWGSHLADRHLPRVDRLRTAHWRLRAYVAAAVLAGVSVLLWLLSTPGMWGALGIWPGLGPRSEWLLTPLPWAWPWLLSAANDSVQPWWLGVTLLGVCLSGWCFSAGQRPRAGLACFGAALLAIGLWALGGAVYHYVAGRGLAGVVDAIAALELQTHAGHRNADTFLWLLSAWFLMAMGALVITGALHIRPAALRHLQP